MSREEWEERIATTFEVFWRKYVSFPWHRFWDPILTRRMRARFDKVSTKY